MSVLIEVVIISSEEGIQYTSSAFQMVTLESSEPFYQAGFSEALLLQRGHKRRGLVNTYIIATGDRIAPLPIGPAIIEFSPRLIPTYKGSPEKKVEVTEPQASPSEVPEKNLLQQIEELRKQLAQHTAGMNRMIDSIAELAAKRQE